MHRLKTVSCACLVLAAVLLSAPPAWPITVQEEEELSREVMRYVRKHFDMVDDPYVQDYVNRVGARILAAMPPQPFAYRFFVLKADDYNAFATPAGYIFIYSGLMKDLDSEEELAGILGHEIAHVSCRHISQKIERSKKIGMATLAGMAAGILLGAGGAGTAAQAVTAGTMAATQSIALAYSREDEMQADQLGLTYLAQAGYSGQGLYTSLKKIRTREYYTTKQIPTYLRTHPASDDRLAYLGARLDSRSKAQKPGGGDTWPFDMARTRLAALHADGASALAAFRQAADGPTDQLAARYGLALSLTRNGQWAEAVENMRAVLAQKAFDPHLIAELGRIYFQQGLFPEALKALESAASIGPNLSDVQFWRGRVLLAQDRFAEAASALEKVRERCPDYQPTLLFLGEAYGRQNRMADAHYNLGLYYFNRLEDKTAVFHLGRALENGIEGNRRDQVKKMLTELKEKRLLEEQENRDKQRRRN